MKPRVGWSRTASLGLLLLGIMGLYTACGDRPEAPLMEVPLVQPSATMIVASPTVEQALQATPTQAAQPIVPLLLETGEEGFSIPLHVQHRMRDKLVVLFELEQAREGRLYWWPVDTPFQQANFQGFGADDTRHLITLTALEPGQAYHVAVALPGADGFDRIPTFMDEIWGPIEVKMTTEEYFPLSIGVFGDSGFGEEVTKDLAAQVSSRDPDLVIHTGDLVYLAYQEGSPQAAYQAKWYQTLASLLKRTVLYPVLGNHELDGDALFQNRPYYFHAFPPIEELGGGWQREPGVLERHWYALELETLQILFLNTQQLYGGPARQEQDAWLESRLADGRFQTTIVVFHVPPLTSGRHNLDGLVVVSSWLPAFEASNVALVLSGHDHNYERLERNGITYVVSGGGSSVLYPLEQRRDESIHFEAVSHYVLLTINADDISLQAFNLEGDMIDSTIIPLR